ncbi:MAG: hypothetical protein KJO97_03610, partial [Acidimicrobiia bacterium]|nr:hypothetical protein [Acidimicrobiia bacterium]
HALESKSFLVAGHVEHRKVPFVLREINITTLRGRVSKEGAIFSNTVCHFSAALVGAGSEGPRSRLLPPNPP